MSVADAPGAEAAPGQIVICPTCSQHMPASFYFCSNCGTDLERVPRTPGRGRRDEEACQRVGGGSHGHADQDLPDLWFAHADAL